MNNVNNNNNDTEQDDLTLGKILKSSGKKFYKILYEDMIMEGFQYHLGLNEDTKPFDLSPTWGGGLHFTDNEDDHLWAFLDYGNMIAEVDIPDDETIVVMGNMYKAHKIILKNVKKIAELSNDELNYLLSGFYCKEKGAELLLLKAVFYGYLNIVQYLINKGIRVQTYANSNYPLMAAAQYGHLNILEYLIDKKVIEQTYDDNGDNTLIHATLIKATQYGHLNIVKYLVEQHGADIHACDDEALSNAARRGYLDIVKFLISHGADIHACNDKALINAAKCGDLNVVEYLVSKGADIHTEKEAALNLAITYGNLNIVKYLIEQGANIHICLSWDSNALMYAARCGYLDTIKYLVSLEINIHSYIKAMIIIALRFRRISIVKYLLNVNNDKNIVKDKKFKKALKEVIMFANDKYIIKVFKALFVNKYYSPELVLRIAAKENLLELVKFCIKNGANVHTHAEYPLRKAIKNENKEMIDYLIEHGANKKNFFVKI